MNKYLIIIICILIFYIIYNYYNKYILDHHNNIIDIQENLNTFNNRGQYNNLNIYNKNDIIDYNNNTYICVKSNIKNKLNIINKKSNCIQNYYSNNRVMYCILTNSNGSIFKIKPYFNYLIDQQYIIENPSPSMNEKILPSINENISPSINENISPSILDNTLDITSVYNTIIKYNGKLWIVTGYLEDGSGILFKYSYDTITFNNISNILFDICFDITSDGTSWVAIGDNSSGKNVAYSNDGIIWNEAKNDYFSGNAAQFDDYQLGSLPNVVVNNGNIWLIGGISDMSSICYSLDCKNWLPTKLFNSDKIIGCCTSITWNGSLWIAGFGHEYINTKYHMLYSYDGITWTNIDSTLFNKDTKDVCVSLCSNGKRTIVLPYNVISGDENNIGYSDDGITWLSIYFYDKIYEGSKIKWDGSQFIILNRGIFSNGSYYYDSYYSIDGINWKGSTFIHNIGPGYEDYRIMDIFTQYENCNTFTKNNDIVIDLNNTGVKYNNQLSDPDDESSLINNINYLKSNMQIVNPNMNSNTIYRIKRFQIKPNGCNTLSNIKDTLILSIYPQIPYNTNIDSDYFYIPDIDSNNFNNYFRKIYDVSTFTNLNRLIPLSSNYINKYNPKTYVFNEIPNITNINTLLGYSVLSSNGVYIGKIIKIKSDIGKKRNNKNKIIKPCLVVTLNDIWVNDEMYYLINIIDPPSISPSPAPIVFNSSLTRPTLNGIETLYPLLDKPTCDPNSYHTVQYNITNSLVSYFNQKNIPITNNAINMCFNKTCPSNTQLTKGTLIFNESNFSNGYICDVSDVNINKNNEKVCINNTILYNTIQNELRCGILPDIRYI